MDVTNTQYEEMMQRAAKTWEPEIEALRKALGKDYGVSITQTGGMCLAIEIELPWGYDHESGASYTMLVTDAADSLPWSREDHEGWSVGVYDHEDESLLDLEDDPFRTEIGTIEALIALVKRADHCAARIVVGKLPTAAEYATELWRLVKVEVPSETLDTLTGFADLHDLFDANCLLIECDKHFDINPHRNARALDVVNSATDIVTGMIMQRNAK